MDKKKRNIFSKDASVRDEEETSQKKQVQSQKGDLDYTPSEQKSTGVDTSWVTRERQKQFEERKNTQYVTTEEDGIKSHIPVTKYTDVPKTDLFDQVRYRMTLSDQEKEEFDKQISFSNRLKEVGEAYESPYLRSSQGNGDYSDKLDLEYDNPAWNNLTRDQKEHYMRLAKIENGDTEDTTDEEFDLYNALRYGDVDAEERYKNSLGNSGRNFTDMDDDYRMMEYATGIYAGYGGYDKDREQSLMWYSLPENVRNELTEGNVSPTTQAYLNNRFSDQAVKMFYKYGEKVRDYNEMQSLRETEEEFLGSNMLYATVIAPLQQAGADIASGFAAPRTMVNALVEGSSGYGVVNPYDSYMQKAAGAGEYVGQSIQSTLEDRGDALGWLASKSYGVNMSAAESAMRMSLARGVAGFAVAKNPLASYDKVAAMAMNAMMGSSVVNQTLTQMINEGVPAEQAAQTAFARGLFECLFETVSLEKIGAFSQTPILKTATAKEFAKNLAKAGFTEGMEEVSTDLANDLYDMLMNYDYSDFEDFAKEHPDWDADTLRSEYIIKKIGDYAGSFLGGAVSGITLGAISGGLAYNNVSNWANQGVSVNDADYARMASVVESVARQDGGVAETLKQMDEEGVDDVIRRGYFKTVVDAIEKNYSQAIDKATDVKQLDNVMENLNRQTNSVISQDIINKYNAKLVEFGKEGKVDYDTFIQNRDSNANTTFSELAFGNGESAIARNIRSDIDTVTEGFNAVAQESLLKKEALRKAAEAQARLEENNERVSTIIRNFAALGKDMDSPEVRKYANLIGIENSAKAYSEGKLASEETIKTSKNGSIASMTQEEINAEFGENAAHIVEYGDVIRGKKNYQLAYNIGQAITKMGINVRLYESDRNSKISNGFYKNGTIYLDINAGVSGVRSAIGETFSHELTHWIRANNESGYQSLLDFVKNELGDEFDKQVKMELGKLKNKDNNVAEEEVVANACARMLKNSETFKKYAIADMSGAQRILARLREFVSNMKKAFQGKLGKDGERAADLISDMEGLQKEWEKALNDAIAETTALEAGIDMETYDDSVVRDAIRDTLEEKDKQGKPKGYDSWEDKVSAMLQEKLGIDKATADKYIRDEQSIASMIFDNIGFLDYKPDDRYEAIKKNSDYPQGTVDLTNLCRKRAIFTEIFDSLQEHFPDKLFNAMDIAEIRQVLKDHGYQVACALCFVEDRRQRVGEIAENFIERLKLAKGGALTVVNSKGQTKTLTMTKDLAKQDVSQRAGFKYGDVIKVTDKYIPTQYDLITYDGFKALSQNHPQVASAFIRANNYLGMSSARLVEGRAEYKRQILDYTPAQVKRINNKGGLRIFSFSDFEAVHLLDICQVITDAAAVGLKIQAYTKVPEFAKLVANTGIKLNRSLIPFGVKGYEVLPDGSKKLKYDTTEGIDINHPDFFDSSDNPNIGNILVGINDEHIRLAMLDDFVDYIIPFHTNQGKNVLAVKGISAWTNYKEYQRERYIDGRKGARDVNIYTQVIDKYNPKNKVEFVNAFLKECKAQKKIPRFDQFLKRDANGEYVYTPGYEKLLLDFKLFDKQGDILPQTTVNPNIDMDTAKNILADEVKNAESRVHVSKQIIKELENKYETRHAARDSEEIYGQDWKPLPQKYQEFLEGTHAVYGDGMIKVYDGDNHSYRHALSYDPARYGRKSYYLRTINPWIASEHRDEWQDKRIKDLVGLVDKIRSEGYDSIEMDGYGEIPGPNGERIMHDNVYLFDDSNRIEVPAKTEDGKEKKEEQKKVVTKYTDNEGNKLSVAQRKFFANSKVRDENGNLKVMYHGTDSAGFTVFDRDAVDDGRSFFFTDDLTVAKTYSGTKDTFAPGGATVKGLNEILSEYGFDDAKLRKVGNKYELKDGETRKTFDSINEAEKHIREYYADDQSDANYAVYLNITNPLIVDAHGSGWDRIAPDEGAIEVMLEYKDGKWTLYKDGVPSDEEFDPWNYGNKVGDDELQEELDAFAERDELENESFYTLLDGTGEYAIEWRTTRTIAEEAESQGYDGVIINNLLDTSIYGSASELATVSTVAIAFEPNQIKSINNTNPTSDDDIRYSLRTLSDGTQYVYLDGDRFLREDGTEMNEKEAYDTIVGTKITLPDGDEITFVKNLPRKKRMFKELFHRLPYNEGVNDINALNKEINQNIVEAYQNSSSVLKNDKDRDGKHSIYGIDSFDTRRVIIADDNAAYDLELTIANLNDGRKIAYAKRSAKANDDIWNEIKKEAKVDKSHKSQPSNKTISQSSSDVNTRNSMRMSMAELDEAYENAYNEYDDDRMQELVDIAAEKAGYKYNAYHHTESDFTVFDLEKARKSMDIQGFFFSADADAEREYGSKRYDVFLKMENPYIVDSKESASRIPFDLSKENSGVTAREWLIENGYDSVIRKADYYGADADEYVVLNANQIKSADVMTFDNDDNLIMPSERFNDYENDIRYSVRDIANSESEMLVNALKNDSAIASDTTSRYSLEQYTKEYNNLRAMEQESFRLAKELKKASPSQRDVLTKKILRLDRQIYKATEKLTEMRTQRVISDILVNEWSKRLADVEWTNELTYQKTKKALEERYGRTIRDLRQKNKNIRVDQKIRDRRKSIENKAKDLMKRLTNPTDKKHIPAVLVEPTAELLNALDFWTPNSEKGDMKFTMKGENLRQKFSNFRSAINNYWKVAQEGEAQIEYMFDQEFFDEIDELESGLPTNSEGGLDTINDMTLEQLEMLDRTLTQLNHLIARGNKMIVQSHYASLEDAQSATAETMLKKKDVRKEAGSVYNRLNAAQADFYAFLRYAGDGTAQIGDALSKAFEQKEWQVKEAVDFTDELLKDHRKEVAKWSKDTHQFTLSSGRTIELPTSQMMEIYLLSNREQARKHMLSELGGKGIHIQNKKGRFVKAVKVNESDIANIVSALPAEAKHIADALQKFVATVSTGWGNMASNLLYGYSKFTEENYWQIRSAEEALPDNATSEAKTQASVTKLQNMGRAKAVKATANNAIYIGDVFDTFSKTIDEMSSYGSVLPAVTDAMRWWNSTIVNEEGERERIKSLIARKMGKDMANVFLDNIRALNGGVLGDSGSNTFLDRVMKFMMGKAKAASVAANMRVVLQQPTAIERALAVIEQKYLTKAMLMKPATKEAQAHSPIAWHKAQGFYSNGLAPSLRQLIVGDATVGEKITEKALWLAGKADDITWGILYNAAMLKVNDTTNLEKGTQKYWDAVNNIFSDIINNTQVVDTPLTKSMAMRSGRLMFFTAFMAEPVKTYNMVMTAVDKIVQDPKNAKNWTRAMYVGLYVFTMTQFINALAQSIADAARDEKDKADYFERYLKYLQKNFIDNMKPWTYIPIIKEIESIRNRYSNNNLALQAAQNTITAVNEINKVVQGTSSKTLYGSAETIAKAFSYATGIPVSSTMRTFRSIANVAGVDLIRRDKYSNAELTANIVNSLDAGDTKSAERYRNELETNLRKSEAYKNQRKELIDKGEKNVDLQLDAWVEKQYTNKVSDYLADESIEINEWALKYLDEATELEDAVQAMSDRYSEDIVVKAIRKSINRETEYDVGDDGSANTIYNSKDINRMLQNGNISEAQKLIDMFEEGYSEMGSSSSPKSPITTYWKPIYLKASLAEKEEIRKMLYKLNWKGKQMYSAKDFEKWK